MPLDLEPIRALLIESDAEAVELTPRDAELDEWWDSYSQLGHGAVLVRGPAGAVPPLAFFMANAPAYVAALLAEVERLRSELTGLRRYLARSIADDIGGMEEVGELLDGLPEEDSTVINEWASAMRDPAYWAPEISRLSAEVEDLRTENAKLRIARAQNDDDIERLRSELAKVEQRFIVRLEPDCWLAAWKGDPGRTCVRESAKRFRTAAAAWSALKKARQFRPFTAAAVERVP